MRATTLRTLLALGMLGLEWRSAEAACCYFAARDKDITQPGQKAFITWEPSEKIESFTVQPKFEGNAVDFGMVIPSPGQPKLDEMPRDFFHDLAIYTILMPLPEPIWAELGPVKFDIRRSGAALGGAIEQEKGGAAVTVLEAGVVGSLDYKIIVAEGADGLYDWLKQNGYVYGGDEATLKFYIDKKWFFTVMKIDPKQMKKNPDGSYQGEVTPTRFTFETEECVYPLKITQISVPTSTDALLYVQAPEQMDLQGDWSFQHSFRVMWLTYMLGCSRDEAQERELAERNAWVEKKRAKDPNFDTTKLEWARKLTPADLAILENPEQNYAQMGGGDLPPGSHFIPLERFLEEVWVAYDQESQGADEEYARQRLQELERQYSPGKGQILKVGKPQGPYLSSRYYWYPNREAPAAEVQGLTRLKGHLREGQWLTKLRKVIRKDEMSGDLLLKPLSAGEQQEYVRILPTSPP